MKKTKKLFSVLMSFIFVFEILPALVIAETIKSDDLKATISNTVQESIEIEDKTIANTIEKKNVLVKSEKGFIFTAENQEYTLSAFEDPMKNNKVTTNVEIPDSFEDTKVIKIGKEAFINQTGVLFVKIPANIVSIDASAFNGCSNLENIEVDSRNSIYYSENGILYTKEDKKEYIVPEKKQVKNKKNENKEILNETVQDPEKAPLMLDSEEKVNDYQYEYINNNTEVKLISYLGLEKNVTIPELIDGKPVTELYGYVRDNSSDIYPVFPEAVTRIKIPKTIKKINEFALKGNALEHIDIDPQNKIFMSIDGVLYTNDKKKLVAYPIKKANTEFVIPASVETILPRAFSNVQNLENVVFPNKLETIGENSFSNCNALKSLNTSAKYIKRDAFAFCKKISVVNLGEGVKEIEENVFNECESLKELKIVKGTQKLTMSKMPNLEKLYIPSSVIEIRNMEKSKTTVEQYIPKTTIYGEKGTVAEKFASENKIPFVDLSLNLNLPLAEKFASENKIPFVDLSLNLNLPLQVTTLKADPTEQQSMGSSVKLTSTASGGETPLNYKFMVENEQGKFFVIKDFSSSNTCTWTPNTLGNKKLHIDVKDRSGKVIRKSIPYKVNEKLNGTFNANPEKSSITKKSVILTAQGMGGTGFYQYKFIIENSEGRFFKIRDFGNAKSTVWIPGAIGVKKLHVDIKDTNGKIIRKTITYGVSQKALQVTSLIANPGAQQGSGDAIQLKAAAIGGVGKYQYKFIVSNDIGKHAIIRDFNSNSSCTWIPGAIGAKTVYVDIKDESGVVVRKALTYKINARLMGSFTINTGTEGVTDSTVTLTAQGTGGSGSYQYKFLVENDVGRFAIIRDYGTSRSASWKLGPGGPKKLHVDIKDNSGKVIRITRSFRVFDSIERFYEHEVLRLVNIERKNVGVPPLAEMKELSLAAQKRADELTIKFSHTRPDESSCFTVLDEYGINCVAGGENIAAGSRTPEDVVEAWMSSEGHRNNILNSNFEYLGVGFKRNSFGYGSYWAQLFITTW